METFNRWELRLFLALTLLAVVTVAAVAGDLWFGVVLLSATTFVAGFRLARTTEQ